MSEKAAELFEISGFRVGSASGAEFLRRNQLISPLTPVLALPYFISRPDSTESFYRGTSILVRHCCKKGQSAAADNKSAGIKYKQNEGATNGASIRAQVVLVGGGGCRAFGESRAG
jgi:hypothetical protein